LEALEAPALRFVALEVCGLGSISVVIQVWMRVERGLRAVGKVEPTSGHRYELILVGVMNRIREWMESRPAQGAKKENDDEGRKDRPDERE
jgi:hypothetical protein